MGRDETASVSAPPRFDQSRALGEGRAGPDSGLRRWKARMPIELKPVTVTDATFSDEVERSPVPVLLDLWAPWCGPCRMIAPVLESLASEWAGRVRIAKLNVDENPATASRFNARSIPLLVVIKDGREVDRIVGVQPRAEIERRLQRVAG